MYHSIGTSDNSTALFEAGVAETILETMKIHEKNKTIQRNGAWAIRNMVRMTVQNYEFALHNYRFIIQLGFSVKYNW